MGKRRRSTTKQQVSNTADEPPVAAGDSASVSRRDGGPATGGLRAWFERNRGDLRFLIVFGACMGLYYLATLTPPVKDGFFPAYLRVNARASGMILGALGEDVRVQGQALVSAKGPSIGIERGCDAVEPSALFVSAVLASPVPLLSRLTAAVAGTFLLMVLNLIRVVSLFEVRVYFPGAFKTMHLDVWQALFIFLAIVLWAAWAARMSRRLPELRHVSP